MNLTREEIINQEFEALIQDFIYWEKTKDIINQLIDIILNYRQSGHPGGSRSKVHVLLATLLSGVMRWDIRHPEKRFADRFILGAGHTIPMVYCTLAVFNEALRIKYQQTGDQRYANHQPEDRILYWEDLLAFRRRGGLSGHAEMEGKTLFLKFNTGPSGHGSPAAAGEALALKRAGAGDVRVFIFEGEGGLTPGATHETLNSAWGLGLDNFYYVVDWNDFGIDDHRISSIIYGTPNDWFASHGWRVFGTQDGHDWEAVAKALINMVYRENSKSIPRALWVKTRKGHGYLKYDNHSHGVPHSINSDLFWETKCPFMEKYGVSFMNFGGSAPNGRQQIKEEFKANLKIVIDVLHDDQNLVDYIADRLLQLAERVPDSIPTFSLGKHGNPFQDIRIYDYQNYPQDLFVPPGTMIANRSGFAKWGAWVNAFGAREYDQPLFLACSADLADSTQISGFAKSYADFPGYGWYERNKNTDGTLLPQGITEFTNAGLMVGMASVNFAEDSEKDFEGFWGACSTYGAFSYLKYGMMRIFSQMQQDSEWKVGKVIWVAGHSGPETADDSRTHFGIFSPGVTQLFPEGSIINLHPWEYNEVAVLLGAALQQDAPIIALHLTRPPIEIPDRHKLGIPSHFTAAKGAYIIKDFKAEAPKDGVLIIQGSSAMVSVIKLLDELARKNLNLKIVCATSYQLFQLQSEEYQNRVLSAEDWRASTVVTTQARWLMHDWLYSKESEKYALSADWDNRWRTGGTLDEVIEEAHLSPNWLLKGIRRFAHDRDK